MKVLIGIHLHSFSNVYNKSYYSVNFMDLMSYLNSDIKDDDDKTINVYFDLLETSTNEKILNQSFKDIGFDYLDIFGVNKYNNDIVYIVVNKELWSLLDLITQVKHDLYYTGSISVYLTEIYNDNVIWLDEKSDYLSFKLGSKDIYVVRYKSITYVDRDRIFWKDYINGYHTVAKLYDKVFSLGLNINSDSDVYILTQNNLLLKLDINKDVIKFMTKCKLLGKRLC